jgi:SWI/SNF-related matrix-associated actin-dependent regulator 1 of chromatin subfamily A
MSYELKVQAGVYFVTGTAYGDPIVQDLKAAGFRWHGRNCYGRCAACAAKVGAFWWTSDLDIAARLDWAADETVKALLAPAVVAPVRPVSIPAPAGLAYLPYQIEGINEIVARGNTLLGDEPGLGKTIQVLGYVNVTASVESVLVICPASLKINWSREAAKWLVRPFRIQVVEAGQTLDPAANFVIVNYDIIRKGDLRDALQARRWNLLVADECHRVKSQKAQQTVAVLGKVERDRLVTPGLVDQADRCLFLTGTPIPNRPVELWPIVSRIAPRAFPNFFKFAKQFCDAHNNGYGWDFSGASNLPELQTKLRNSVLVRRLKADVLKDLPAKRRQIIELAPNGASKLLARENALIDSSLPYEEAVKKLRGSSAAFEEISKLRHEIAVSKIDKVADHVGGALDDGTAKIVVFAHHLAVLRGLAEKLSDYGVVTLTGDSSAEDRQAAVDRFQNDPTVRVFVGSITAAGVGLTLTAASTVVFAELDWVPGNVVQAEDRCHRIGQTGSVLVQYLIYSVGLDALLAVVLAAKEEVAAVALDRPVGSVAAPVALPSIRVQAQPAAPVKSPLVIELEAVAGSSEVPF